MYKLLSIVVVILLLTACGMEGLNSPKLELPDVYIVGDYELPAVEGYDLTKKIENINQYPFDSKRYWLYTYNVPDNNELVSVAKQLYETYANDFEWDSIDGLTSNKRLSYAADGKLWVLEFRVKLVHPMEEWIPQLEIFITRTNNK